MDATPLPSDASHPAASRDSTASDPVSPRAPSSTPSTARRRLRWPELPALLLSAALWAIAIWHLSAEWTLNPQYSYGWAVPFLAAYLVFTRLPARLTHGPSPALAPRRARAFLLLLAAVTAATLPLREANPEWRLLGWLYIASAIAGSAILLARVGGPALARHFAFPLLFILTAVPWPRIPEHHLMDTLMRTNAQVAAEGLRWLGHHATARGSLIALPEGTVSVDGACSGVRTLQGFLMLTLFVGEILQLTGFRRLILLISGLAWSLLANLLRTTLLGTIAARTGIPSVDRWHDLIGYTTLALGFALLLTLAALLRPRPLAPPDSATTLPLPPFIFPLIPGALRPLRTASLTALALLLTSLAGTQAWFAWHERGAVHTPAWSIHFPATAPGFRQLPLTDPIQTELRCDEGRTASWADPAGRLRYHAFYLRWSPGRTWEQTVLIHDPRVCLQASGLQFIETLPPLPIQHQQLQLTFDSYHFRDPTGPLYVFNCVSHDLLRPTGPTTGVPLSRSARLDALRAGLRHRGLRRLEIGIWGAAGEAEARAAVQALLSRQLEVEGGGER